MWCLYEQKGEFGKGIVAQHLQGNVVRARGFYEEALKYADAHPFRAKVLIHLADLLKTQESNDERCLLLYRALRLDPQVGEVHIGLLEDACMRRDVCAVKACLDRISQLLNQMTKRLRSMSNAQEGEGLQNERNVLLQQLFGNPQLTWMRQTTMWCNRAHLWKRHVAHAELV